MPVSALAELGKFLAGAEGFEPPLAVLETAGLPLNLRPCREVSPHYSVHESMSAVESAAFICRTCPSNFAKQSQSQKTATERTQFRPAVQFRAPALRYSVVPQNQQLTCSFGEWRLFASDFTKQSQSPDRIPNEANGRRSTWFRGAAGASDSTDRTSSSQGVPSWFSYSSCSYSSGFCTRCTGT